MACMYKVELRGPRFPGEQHMDGSKELGNKRLTSQALIQKIASCQIPLHMYNKLELSFVQYYQIFLSLSMTLTLSLTAVIQL
jgi:hypothetical protein